MALQGIITNIGIQKVREAALNEGWNIVPIKFSVSNVQSELSPDRTTPNTGVWYESYISSRVIVSYNAIKFVCTIPPEQIPEGTLEYVREMYIFCSLNGNDFLFAIGQPSTQIQYDPSGSVTLDLQIALTNNDLSSIIVFKFTQATEILEHNTDPNAHPEIVKEMNNAGQYLDAGGMPFTYRGQWYDKKADFTGTQATAIRGGITFKAVYRDPRYNGLTISFDGVKTVNQVVAAFNIANPFYPITHNSPTGNEVLAAGTIALSGGVRNVNQNELVYKDTDGLYKKAVADGTIKSKVVGVADVERRIVHAYGFFAINTGYPVGTDLFLHDVVPGSFKNTPTGIKVGTVLDTNLILLSAIGGLSGLLTQSFDAIVSNSPGYKYFSTTQQAIDNVPDGGKILVDKYESIIYQLNTQNKNLQFYFNGPNTGWYKSPGQYEEQKIIFSQVPTSGTWRIEWNSQETVDLAYNATALDVQNAMNSLTGHGGVTVTGDYSVGFTITYNNMSPMPIPTFNHTGQNEIQKFEYSNAPDNGTIQFQFEGQNTAYVAWNDINSQVEGYLEELSTINNVIVSGGFNLAYHVIEFIGLDGLSPKSNILVNSNTLSKLGIPVTYTHSVIQEGKYPANNLKSGGNPITITAIETVIGTPYGPDTAILLTSNNCKFVGLGKIKDFTNGIDFNGYTGHRIEMLFENVQVPIIADGMIPGIDYNTSGSIGFQDDIFDQLKLIEHPSNKQRVKVSAADYTLANGGRMVQELNKMIMKFDGAEIDFSTGVIYKSDGINPLGINFVPATIGNGKYRWYGITVIPKQVSSDNRIEPQLYVTVASSDGDTMDSAPRAVFVSGKKLGQVCVKGGSSGIENIYQTQIDQLGIGSGSGDGGESYTPYILNVPTTSLEFLSNTFTWSSQIGIINPFYGEFVIPAGSMSSISNKDILYTKLYSPVGFIANGTASGEVFVSDISDFNDNDSVIIGDSDSVKVAGYVYGTPSGNKIVVDDGGGNVLNLTNFTVDKGAWILKTNVSLYKSQSNVGDLKPDSIGNILPNIFIVGMCLGNSIFLVNGIEVTRSWFYEESLIVPSDISPGDTITLPVDSRNSDNIKNYRNGVGDLEVFLNGVSLERNKILITNTYQPISYDDITGIVYVPDTVDLSLTYRDCIFVDGSGAEFRILGNVINEVGNKQFNIGAGKTVSLSTGAYNYKQDYIESGTYLQYVNTIVSKISIPAGSVLKFRISPLVNKGNGTSGGGGASTLQEAYNGGNIILVESGKPFTINGPSGEKIAKFNGDIEVTGLIDPVGIVITRQSSNPIPSDKDGIWFNSSGEVYFNNKDTGSAKLLTSIDASGAKNYLSTSSGVIAGRAVRKYDSRHVVHGKNDTQINASVIGIAATTKTTEDEPVLVYKYGTVPSGVITASSFVENALPSEGSWVFLSGDDGKLTITPPTEGSDLWAVLLGIWDEGELNLMINQWGQA